MAEIILFHHVQGLTPGVAAFAETLRQVGHTAHTPDLFEGLTFNTIDDGMAFARDVGFGEILERGTRAAEAFPASVVYAGFSMGVMPAQKLAQTRPGAQGALFFHSCLPVAEFGAWPAGVPVQIHAMEADPFFVEEGGDIDAARELVASAANADLDGSSTEARRIRIRHGLETMTVSSISIARCQRHFFSLGLRLGEERTIKPVSYTHLTLPTIYSV